MTTTLRMIMLAVAAALSLALVVQERDARVAPAGTGEISGVVMSADQTPQPVRRAVVSIAAAELPAAKSAITDDTGRFAFTRLPPGAYSVTVTKPAHLPAEHGSAKPGRPGSRVALSAGERRAVTLTIFRGAAIGGVLRDPAGQPLAGVSVAAINLRGAAPGTGIFPAPTTTVTDDRGTYRLYGLMPGEYIVAANPTTSGAGEIGARESADMDALLAAIAQRQQRTGQPAAPLPPLPESRSIGFAAIYFPGTPVFADATRVRLAAGEDREALNFAVSHVPVASIRGVVSGNVADLSRVQLAIVPDTPRLANVIGTYGITSDPPNADGEFSYGNLAPGRYRITARARQSGSVDPNAPPPGAPARTVGVGGGQPPAGVNLLPAGDLVYGVIDVDVIGHDVNGVTLPLRPGGAIAGTVVFDRAAAPVPDDLTALRVGTSLYGGSWVSSSGTTRVGNALSALQPVNLDGDGSFLITGIGIGTYFVNVTLPANLTSTWKVRTAIVDGRDLLDTMIEGPDVNLRNVTVTLSDKITALSGTLQSASGQPTTEYYVVAFSADRAHWRPGSRRSLSSRPDTAGRFSFADLPAGEFLLAALTDLDPAEWQEAAFLEQVAPLAIKVTVREGEKKVQDLRIQ